MASSWLWCIRIRCHGHLERAVGLQAVYWTGPVILAPAICTKLPSTMQTNSAMVRFALGHSWPTPDKQKVQLFDFWQQLARCWAQDAKSQQQIAFVRPGNKLFVC